VRRRLAILSLATTTLVVISLLIPLGLLVRRQAGDRARLEAERQAQSTAALLALAVTFDAETDSIESVLGTLDEGEIVVFSGGNSFGRAATGQGSLVESALGNQATVTMLVDGGWEIALPVIGREEVAVVDVFVSDAELREGVAGAWGLLAGLGVILIGSAALVADRLGANLVKPIRNLAATATRMGEGDLTARADLDGPPEIQEVGEAFNQLAGRLEELLIEEREAVADLSHRLRTPLTSLRLQAEKISDAEDRNQVVVQVDRLEQSIDQLILATRSRGTDGGRCALDKVVKDRTAFWLVLAEEQDRRLTLRLGANDVELGMSSGSVEAVVDTLIGNVFSHTPTGGDFTVATGETNHRPWLEVVDDGPGFPDASLVDRGRSGGGSTGLGLDIVKRTAELTGGELEVMNQPGGGAVVRVWFG
jgi:signal transduction histidine kinase